MLRVNQVCFCVREQPQKLMTRRNCANPAGIEESPIQNFEFFTNSMSRYIAILKVYYMVAFANDKLMVTYF